jgi:hypothetical protein
MSRRKKVKGKQPSPFLFLPPSGEKKRFVALNFVNAAALFLLPLPVLFFSAIFA